MSQNTSSLNIVDRLNNIGDEVNSVLNGNKVERYFECIIMLDGLLEYLTKWLTFVKILWDKSKNEIRDGEAQTLRNFFTESSYATNLYLCYSTSLIDYPVFQELLRLKNQRNDFVHDFWLLSSQTLPSELREELEKLAHAANALVGIFNKLTEEVGVDEVYDLFMP